MLHLLPSTDTSFSPSGTVIEHVGVTKLPTNQVPLLLNSGVVVVQTFGGKLIQTVLSTHSFQEGGSVLSAGLQPSDIEVLLKKHLKLRRFVVVCCISPLEPMLKSIQF